MKFGVFYELSVPRPWDHEAERQVYLNALEQVRLADELGFTAVWAVEHHFLEEYSHCSAPELFLTACAMQTRRLRVGHGDGENGIVHGDWNETALAHEARGETFDFGRRGRRRI